MPAIEHRHHVAARGAENYTTCAIRAYFMRKVRFSANELALWVGRSIAFHDHVATLLGPVVFLVVVVVALVDAAICARPYLRDEERMSFAVLPA